MMVGKELRSLESGDVRSCPEVVQADGGVIQVLEAKPGELKELYGLNTDEAAKAIFMSGLVSLGKAGETYRPFIAAIAAELEPTDAAEAMLVTQMAATHAAMTTMAGRVADAANHMVRESYERSMTRLSRTYLAQLEALKRYRSKAQQIVRVERVVVEEGGRAIVGSVQHGGEGGR